MLKPLVIAHRGDSSNALENSLEAITLAVSLPSDMIEIDIHRSRDNNLYLMHDKDTGRTCDKNINIEQATSDEISLVRLRNGEPIPVIKDALGLISGRVGLNIEIKSEGAGGLCAAHISGSGYKGPVMFSSFHEREVLDVRRIMPKAPTAEILDSFTRDQINRYKEKGYGIISLKKKTVTEELISECHDKKIKVYVWTIDEEDEMKKFISWEVDGIYTNRPGVLKKLVEDMTG